ncbi:hypothetical protein COF68_05630 [Bacillus toyonensis]|uniref:hypothetical protein n=1 Tax=Bacillus toyonensis TaxID=155322 RepID=UPI000BFB8291|nr:hypothetical protein [Bacillus toyonensis]PHE64323.1 hypothetical protein COF68_05630 [Bacillus toyonensis]
MVNLVEDVKGLKDLKGEPLSFGELIFALKEHEGYGIELSRVDNKDNQEQPLVREHMTGKLHEVCNQGSTWFKFNLEQFNDVRYYFKDLVTRILKDENKYYLIYEDKYYVEFVLEEKQDSNKLTEFLEQIKADLGVLEFTKMLTFEEFKEFADNVDDFNISSLTALTKNGTILQDSIDTVITNSDTIKFELVNYDTNEFTLSFKEDETVAIMQLTNSSNKYFMIYGKQGITPVIFR